MKLSESKITSFLQNNKDDVLLCYCLWLSLPLNTQEKYQKEFSPYVAYMISEDKRWRKCHRKEAFYIRPAMDVLNDYVNFKKPFSARMELRERLPYLSLEEQYAIISAFVGRDRSNRKWALGYISEHWNNKFKDLVKKSFETYHESMAAEIICHYFDVKYISMHAENLAKSYSYYEVRKRLPLDAPIDKNKLYGDEYLRLAYILGIEICDEEIYKQLLSILQRIGKYYIKKHSENGPKSLVEVYGMGRTICAIANLKRPHIVNWLAEINGTTKDMFARNAATEYESYIIASYHKVLQGEL